MEKCAYRCFTTSVDGKYEYLHLLKVPEGNFVKIPLAADGAVLSAPVSLCEGVEILDFQRFSHGYTLQLGGEFDAVDSVIRFERAAVEHVPCKEWMNDSDKRVRYEGAWKYVFLTSDPQTHTTLGSYESDYHVTTEKGSSFFTYFEGSSVSLYGNKRPGNGKARVYIDGVFSGEVCEDSTLPENRSELFRSIDLFGGIHTLYVVSDSEAPFEFDAIQITK